MLCVTPELDPKHPFSDTPIFHIKNYKDDETINYIGTLINTCKNKKFASEIHNSYKNIIICPKCEQWKQGVIVVSTNNKDCDKTICKYLHLLNKNPEKNSIDSHDKVSEE